MRKIKYPSKWKVVKYTMSKTVRAIFDDIDSADFAVKYLKEQGMLIHSRTLNATSRSDDHDQESLVFPVYAPIIGSGATQGFSSFNTAVPFVPFFQSALHNGRGYVPDDTAQSDVVLKIEVDDQDAKQASDMLTSMHGRSLRII